jgi:hypothetical protein
LASPGLRSWLYPRVGQISATRGDQSRTEPGGIVSKTNCRAWRYPSTRLTLYVGLALPISKTPCVSSLALPCSQTYVVTSLVLPISKTHTVSSLALPLVGCPLSWVLEPLLLLAWWVSRVLGERQCFLVRVQQLRAGVLVGASVSLSPKRAVAWRRKNRGCRWCSAASARSSWDLRFCHAPSAARGENSSRGRHCAGISLSWRGSPAAGRGDTALWNRVRKSLGGSKPSWARSPSSGSRTQGCGPRTEPDHSRLRPLDVAGQKVLFLRPRCWRARPRIEPHVEKDVKGFIAQGFGMKPSKLLCLCMVG